MTHTLYDDTARVVPGRVAGYAVTDNGFANAAYLSMTQPYAAGSLASSVDDLARWDAALYTGELLKPETLSLAHQSYRLSDGSLANYGYGWAIGDYEGFKFIEHAGGINGFLCGGVRVPAEMVYVAVLTNLEAPRPDPDMLAFQLAAMVIGKPYVPPTAIELEEKVLQEYVGVYSTSETDERVITCEDGQLYFRRTGGMRLKLFPYAPDSFFINEAADFFIFTRADDAWNSRARASRDRSR